MGSTNPKTYKQVDQDISNVTKLIIPKYYKIKFIKMARLPKKCYVLKLLLWEQKLLTKVLMK